MIKKLAKQIHDELYETYPGSGDKLRGLRQELKHDLIQEAINDGKIKPHEAWILKTYLNNLGKTKQATGWVELYNK